MKTLKIRGYSVNILTGALLALFLLPHLPQARAGAEMQGRILHNMVYDVYAGGIHAVQAELEIDLAQSERYELALSARTRGFLGSLAPWSGRFETAGWLDENGPHPELHRSLSTWRGETEIKEYSYSRDGSFRTYRVTEEGKDKTPALEKDVAEDTTDALTATMLVMQSIAEGGRCEGISEVFDGKRRFELAFSHVEDVRLQSSRYNIYEGPAAVCEVEVRPLAGKWHDKPRGWMSIQEQGREKGTMPTVWMGRLTEDGPAVPVKIRVKTNYGTLFMHLTGHEIKEG